MYKSYNIYCVSNASEENFKDNDLTCFKNLLPQNLDLKNKQWEIGIVKFGFFHSKVTLSDVSLFSILTDVVIDSPDGDKYSNLVYDTSLPKSTKGKYYHHYVKHIKYYPIRNTFIDTITVKFVDIHGKKLLIKKGKPSFVHFNLRTMHSEENYKINYIRLNSENTTIEKRNTNNDFWTHLKDPINLDENSEVALVNINFPNTIRHINFSLEEKQILITIRKKAEDKRYQFRIPARHYSSTDNFISTLNLNLPHKLKTLVKFANNNDHLKIISNYDKAIVFSFPIEFDNILGFDSAKKYFTQKKSLNNKYIEIVIKKDTAYTTPKEINLLYNYPNVMLCHANFVQHSIVGDSYCPILKIIPVETSSKDNYISYHFEYLEFVKTNVEYFKDLHIQLKNLNGDKIEFDNNKKVILNIAVKKL